MTEEKKNVGEQTANVKTKEKAINIKEENHQEKSKVEIKNAEKPTQSSKIALFINNIIYKYQIN